MKGLAGSRVDLASFTMRIGDRLVGPGQPTYIVAELSCNHGQKYATAQALVTAAAAAGADAVKLQTYSADRITIDCDKPQFQLTDTPWEDCRTLHALYTKGETPRAWHRKLRDYALSLGMELFSSPFDVDAVRFLNEEVGVPAFKIASFEITDHALLKAVAATGKPVIVSTGIAGLGDITEALEVLRNNGAGEICLLKCTSAYPAPIEAANLRTIPNMAETFHCLSGLSDHTTGIEAPVAAVALGASIIEKHFKLADDPTSPDNAFSLTVEEFTSMVASIRRVELALGTVQYTKSALERSSARWGRSLYCVRPIKAGERFTPANVRSIRPGDGLHPRLYDSVIGSTAAHDIASATPLALSMVGLWLEPVNPETDAETTLGWANDPETVAASPHRLEPVTLEQHRAWMHKHAAELWLARVPTTDTAVALLRLQPDGSVQGRAVVSINVAPAARGRGLGRQALQALLHTVVPERGVTQVIAEILPHNKRSQRLFREQGFQLISLAEVARFSWKPGQLSQLVWF